MARIYQVGLLLLIVKLIEAQGDEGRGFPQQLPYPTARGSPDRYYYLWTNPQQPNGFHNFHGFPDHVSNHFQQQQFGGQDVPYFFRNFPNNQGPQPQPQPQPQFPPLAPVNPQQFPNQGREPVLFLLPPGEQPVNPGFPGIGSALPPIPQGERSTAAPSTASTTTQAPLTETESSETSRATEGTSTTESHPIKDKESERSGVLFKSATSGFTNAHHYPFPIGLWSEYKKSAGLDKVDEPSKEEPSPVNPRRFPSLLIVPPNQFAFALSPQQNSFPDWSYGYNSQQHVSFGPGSLPTGLMHYDDNDDIIGEKQNGGRSNVGDSRYQFFAVPLRSVLNQVNAENENSRV